MVRKCTRGRAPLPLPAGGGRAALQVLPLHAKEVPCAVKGVRPRADRSRYARAWDGAVFRGAREGAWARESQGKEVAGGKGALEENAQLTQIDVGSQSRRRRVCR